MVTSQLTEKGVGQYSTGLLKAYKHVKLILTITSLTPAADIYIRNIVRSAT